RAALHETTCIGERLDRLCGLVNSRTLEIVISDLHDPTGVPAIKRMAQRHDAIVLQLEDPAERGRLRCGLFHAVEAETGRMFVSHGRSRWFDDPLKHPRRALSAAGIDYLLLATDRPFVAPLRRLLADRGGLVRNAR
ncbi:MAG: hypothetical protein WEH44_07615, partial [Pirellulaceae bacterium]